MLDKKYIKQFRNIRCRRRIRILYSSTCLWSMAK